ncbi:MAG: TonB-dependent receptor [Opitutaceae bacterium]|jgi:iron complex outermembrane receptor protein
MHPYVRFSLALAVASLARGQVTPPPSTSTTNDQAVLLDDVVVTGSPDPKTAFDLAQGTSLLSGDALRLREQGTLGQTLDGLPGVSSTSYGPGASRPLIRGLGGDRVRMLESGVGSLDASNVSPDHNVSVEPLFAERIEVLRGPATLLYGSSAVGGVVNVIDNRIPSVAPTAPVSGRAEARFDTAANERTGILAVTTGNEHVAFQFNGLRTETDDVDIPGVADPSVPTPKGTLPQSSISTKSASVGGTYFWKAGFAGVAVSEYDTTYGIPGTEPIEIDMKQRRLDFRGEITQPFAVFKAAKARLGLADYTHSEVDTTTGTPNTTFNNSAYEGRLELIQQDVGDWSGTLGLQTSRSDFSAVGVEVVTPQSLTYNHALFALEEYQLNRSLTLQFGARVEFQSIKLGTVDPSLPLLPGNTSPTSGEKNSDHSFSLSTGAVLYPAKDYSLGLSLTWSQRLPTAQERYSNGPHGGTGSYEVGSPGLDRETSIGLDLTLRKRAGFVTGSVGGFINQFQNFVFEQRVPGLYFQDATGTFQPGSPVLADDLPIYQFIAKDALFYGGEAEISFHLRDTDTDHLHLTFTSDYVHAQQTTDDEPLPRIPPFRAGVALRYEHGPWSFGTDVRHAFRQDRVSPGETETAGYTLVGADVTYRFAWNRIDWELFVRGTNLTNEDARLSTSFLKDVAPLAGRNATFGLRAAF